MISYDFMVLSDEVVIFRVKPKTQVENNEVQALQHQRVSRGSDVLSFSVQAIAAIRCFMSSIVSSVVSSIVSCMSPCLVAHKEVVKHVVLLKHNESLRSSPSEKRTQRDTQIHPFSPCDPWASNGFAF